MFAHYPTNAGVLILVIDFLVKFIFELCCIILVFYRNNFSFHTPWHVFPPPHFLENLWSTFSKLNPSTVTMVVFCNNMVGGRLFMNFFLGVNIITRLLNISVAGGKR
jgi:hypothetical protein